MNSYRIGILESPGMLMAGIAPLLDLAHFIESSGQIRRRREGVEFPSPEVELVVEKPAEARSAPWPLKQVALSDDIEKYSAILVPACDMRPSYRHDRAGNDAKARWLRRQHAAGTAIGAIGSGVLKVAAAGLIDGASASVPDTYDRLFRKLHPQITAMAGSTLVRHGQVVTAGELALAVPLAGALAALASNQGLAINFLRASGVIATGEGLTEDFPLGRDRDPFTGQVRDWLIAHIADDIDMEQLARSFGVSNRTLSRRFKANNGMTPHRFLREARVDATCAMLRRTQLSVDQVARCVGYRDASFFREIFTASTGSSPSRYRRQR